MISVVNKTNKKASFACTQKIDLKRKLELSIVSKEHIELNKSQKVTGISKGLLSPRCEDSIRELIDPLPSELSSQAYLLPESPKDICSRLLIIGEEIGRGTYAVVKSAYHKQLERTVALKIYNKSEIKTIQRKANIQHEVEVLKLLHNPFTIKLYEVLEDKNQVILIMEHIRGQNLYDYVKKGIEENEVKRIFKQIVTGIDYCHKKSIAHRDIKLENILLDKNNNVKIIDFGFSTFIPNLEKIHCGTLSYMAPEIISHLEHASLSADIWSLGVLLYAMLTKKFPFKAKTERELLQQIHHFNIPNTLPARSLITRMLQIDPNKRPDTNELLQDSWLNGNNLSSSGRVAEIKKQAQIDCAKKIRPRVKYSPPKKTIINKNSYLIQDLNKKRILKYSIDYKKSSAVLNVTIQPKMKGSLLYKSIKDYRRNNRINNPTINEKKY